MSNLYWNPEQPPPSTLTRSIVPCGSCLRISPIRRAARSETVTLIGFRAHSIDSWLDALQHILSDS